MKLRKTGRRTLNCEIRINKLRKKNVNQQKLKGEIKLGEQISHK